MAPRKKKRNLVREINQGLELGIELVKQGQQLLEKFFAPLIPPAPPGPRASLDPYDLFGLPQTASKEDFQKRYRELANAFHPDKFGGSDVMMKLLNQHWAKIKEDQGWQ